LYIQSTPHDVRSIESPPRHLGVVSIYRPTSNTEANPTVTFDGLECNDAKQGESRSATARLRANLEELGELNGEPAG